MGKWATVRRMEHRRRTQGVNAVLALEEDASPRLCRHVRSTDSVFAREFAALAIHPLTAMTSKQWHRLACPCLARALGELNLMPVLRNSSSERRHECLNLA